MHIARPILQAKARRVGGSMSGLFGNRLGEATSPYLRQHQDNPVAWQPWDGAALEMARRLDRPIFLSVGYSTCHWCHVMARESFSCPEIARVLNTQFLPIKVDREERPDVDRQYMAYLQAAQGSGGWPMSVFIEPVHGRPFFAGTYFTRPMLLRILEAIGAKWGTDRGEVMESAEEGSRVLGLLSGRAAKRAEAGAPDAARMLYGALDASFDPEFGGFGGAPKFPTPSALEYLLAYDSCAPAGNARGMVVKTLRVMTEQGIHDQLAGGYHRYSVDRAWGTPHFEKMLYDQGQLLCILASVKRCCAEEWVDRAARGIYRYVTTCLRADTGAFYSAEDAESIDVASGRKEEGAYYVWTAAELREILGEGYEAAKRLFSIEEAGNAAGNELVGKNTLRLGQSSGIPKEEMDAIVSKLAAARSQRPRPHRDEKVLASWNGLLIAGLAEAARAFDEGAVYLGTALEAFSAMALGKGLERSLGSGIGAFADDYANLIRAALAIYRATIDQRYLDKAVELQDIMDEKFLDPQSKKYYYAQEERDRVILRTHDDYDGAEPSANSTSALNLLELHHVTGSPMFKEKFEELTEAFSVHAASGAMPLLLKAMLVHQARPFVVTIEGEYTADFKRAIFKCTHPVFVRGTGTTAAAPRAIVCRESICYEPCSSAKDLESMLSRA